MEIEDEQLVRTYFNFDQESKRYIFDKKILINHIITQSLKFSLLSEFKVDDAVDYTIISLNDNIIELKDFTANLNNYSSETIFNLFKNLIEVLSYFENYFVELNDIDESFIFINDKLDTYNNFILKHPFLFENIKKKFLMVLLSGNKRFRRRNG